MTLKNIKILLCLFLCLFGIQVAHSQETLTVAVASSLYPYMQTQRLKFEQKHGISIRLVSGSTGRLYNQILRGAPFDVFIAADQQRPALLVEKKIALATYPLGQAYVGLQVGNLHTTKLASLTQKHIQHIAIANPNVAPFGMAAKTVLQQHQLWQILKEKLVYAQNALQAQMMLNQGLVDAAFLPVRNQHDALASITYVGTLLNNKKNSLSLLNIISHDFYTP